MATLTISAPLNNEQVKHSVDSSVDVYVFDFSQENASFEKVDTNLLISFEGNSSVLIENFYQVYPEGFMPDFVVNKEFISSEEFLFATNSALMPVTYANFDNIIPHFDDTHEFDDFSDLNHEESLAFEDLDIFDNYEAYTPHALDNQNSADLLAWMNEIHDTNDAIANHTEGNLSYSVANIDVITSFEAGDILDLTAYKHAGYNISANSHEAGTTIQIVNDSEVQHIELAGITLSEHELSQINDSGYVGEFMRV